MLSRTTKRSNAMKIWSRSAVAAILLVFIAACAAITVIIWLRESTGKNGLTADTPLDHAQLFISPLITPGMELETARDVAVSLGFEMANSPDQDGVLLGIIRGSSSITNPVHRSLQLRIFFDETQQVDRIECFEAFTGP